MLLSDCGLEFGEARPDIGSVRGLFQVAGSPAFRTLIDALRKPAVIE